jgi:CheY-like chemotaxis protein
MNVQSKPDHGSRFEAWLPAVTADSTPVVGPAVLPLGRGETVLVVESERERLLYNEEMLAALGYEPVGFERPADAIAACRSAPDRFDIILVSHASQIPVGLDLTHTLHEIAPRQPILLATSSTIDVGVDALAEAGISELLRRPLVSTELAAALARCLRCPGTLQT